MIKDKKAKFNSALFNSESKNFIPIACHYDETTLLTKNGELIQTLLINGINSDSISENLVNLREMVRLAIRNNIKTDNFAFWIHTVRKKTNLDGNASYNKFFSNNLHKIWQQKNYWHDKFVNTLYITIVYTGADLNIKSVKSYFSSLSYFLIKSFHEEYLEKSKNILDSAVNKIIDSLKEFGATKLSVIINKEGCYSDLLLLYSKIIHLYDNKIPLPYTDLSEALSTHKYAVGDNKLEVINNESKKFASIISLKEYQEISTEELDKFLQLPIEMIASEIFYFIPKDQALTQVKYQDNILKISNDEELRQWKGISNIAEAKESNAFCNQQISITIISSNLEQLEHNTHKAANALSKLGIMHVREDINLEQTFWAQLPGNFNYLKRAIPSLTRNIASLASLHNFPTGSQETCWGGFVTLLRTEKSTPYFMNFHINETTTGHTGIFGVKKSGKTILTNFLLSEATKYNPTILYLTDDDSSKILIEALQGKWHNFNIELENFNPFICEDTETNRQYLKKIINILFKKDELNVSAEFINKFTQYVVTQPIEKRTLQNLVEGFFLQEIEFENYKIVIEEFIKVKKISDIFNNSLNYNIELNDINGFNLRELTESDFENKNYPSDPKQRNAYYDELNILNKTRAIFLQSLIYKVVNLEKENPKIIVIDNFFSLFNYGFDDSIHELLNDIEASNGIIIATVNIEEHDKLLNLPLWKNFYSKIATKIILSSEIVLDDLDKLLELTRPELKKLKTLKPLKRLFMIKQLENSIIAELSLGGLQGILKMLSCSPEDIEIYNKLNSNKEDNLEKWLEELYEALNKQT